jgi:hypothetical protein
MKKMILTLISSLLFLSSGAFADPKPTYDAGGAKPVPAQQQEGGLLDENCAICKANATSQAIDSATKRQYSPQLPDDEAIRKAKHDAGVE